jgi:DNA-binding NarL/FixJ family response regulator
MTRVLIADDQPRARRSLAAVFTAMRWTSVSDREHPAPDSAHPGPLLLEIVGEAENGQQAVEQVLALRPDVIVMDLHLSAASCAESRLDGLAAIRMIKHGWPAIRIVVLTMYATDRASVLAAGADAFLLKGCPTSELLQAVLPTLESFGSSRCEPGRSRRLPLASTRSPANLSTASPITHYGSMTWNCSKIWRPTRSMPPARRPVAAP